jgi:hypothetical protein
MFDDFDDFDDEEMDQYSEEEMEAFKKLPIYRKAIQIGEITKHLVDTFDEKKDQFMLREQMMVDAYTLGAKVAGAECGDLYSIRMENAVIIKRHANELLAATSMCSHENLAGSEYLQLLRDEIEEFRKLFVEWIGTFDRSNDVEDDWGLWK